MKYFFTTILARYVLGACSEIQKKPNARSAEVLGFWAGALMPESIKITAHFSQEGLAAVVLSTDPHNFVPHASSEILPITISTRLFMTFSVDSLKPATTYYYRFVVLLFFILTSAY